MLLLLYSSRISLQHCKVNMWQQPAHLKHQLNFIMQTHEEAPFKFDVILLQFWYRYCITWYLIWIQHIWRCKIDIESQLVKKLGANIGPQASPSDLYWTLNVSLVMTQFYSHLVNCAISLTYCAVTYKFKFVRSIIS